MSEERIMILTMLQEGKISSEEASTLLDALDEAELKEAEKHGTTEGWENNIDEKLNKISEKINEKADKFKEKRDKFNKKSDKFGEKMDKHGEELEDWGNKLGAKMSRIGGDLAEGATSFTDKMLDMVDNLVEKGTFNNFFGNYETVTELLEKDISTSILEFEAINGKISLTPWSEDRILVKAVCQVKKTHYNPEEKIYEIIEKDNKLIFKPKYTSNIGTRLEIFIPNKEYEKINLITSNGRIEVKDLNSRNLLCDTTNSSISIIDVSSKDIKATTKNGRVLLDDTKANMIKVTTTNSSVLLEDVSSSSIEIVTNNGKITGNDVTSKVLNLKTSNASISLQDCKSESVYAKTSNGTIAVEDICTTSLNSLELITSNSKVDVDFADKDSSFSIDAVTSMGHIDIKIPLVYEINNQQQLGSKRIKGHSPNSNGKEIIVNITTSNGSININ